jgi:hypothetical protein
MHSDERNGEQHMTNVATDRQLAFMARLADEREINDVLGTRLAGVILAHREGREEMSKGKASEIIDWLIAQPVRAGAVVQATTSIDLTELAEGRYAIGDVLFVIQHPEAGKWAGWVFVKNGSEYVDEKFGSQKPGGTYRGVQADLLSIIVEDPQAAMRHYGEITGRCGVCNRTLEDEVSVARGIGPVCWEKVS